MAVVVGTAQGKLTLNASSFVSEIDKSYKALKSLNELVSDTQKRLKDLSNADVNVKVNADTSGLSNFDVGSGQDALNNIGSGAETATSKVNILKSALNTGLTGALKGVGTLAKVTFEAFEKYTKFVVDFGKDSLMTGQQFDATMSQVSAIAGATGEEFDALREKALEMGAQTKFSAQEAGQALVYMGMAGWKTEDMLDGIEGIMSLAAASGEDLATTSDIVTDALTAFGLEAKDAAHFSDVLAAASTNSNTNVALMGDTFKYIAPLAGTMKYSIEDTAVAIGLMANSGIKGSQAGTSLRNIISNLAAPTKKSAAAMAELGLSLADADGNSKDLMTIMKDLRTAFSGLSNDKSMQEYQSLLEGFNVALESGVITQEDYDEGIADAAANVLKSLDTLQAGYANAIAGKYGLSGLLAIVNASDEDFQKLTESIYGASDGMGAAADMSETMMNNLQGSVTIFKSTLETFKISISDILKEPANEIVKFGQQSLAGMNKALNEEGIPGLIKTIGSIIPKAAKEIIKLIPEILPSLIQGFWALIKGLTDAIAEFSPMLIDAGFDLFLGLVEGLVDATNRWLEVLPEAMRQFIDKLLENAPRILESAIELFMNIVQATIDILPDLIRGAVGLIKRIVTTLKDHAADILKAGIDLFLALIEGLTDPDTIQDLILAMGTISSTIIDALASIDWLETADKIFSGLGQGLLNVITGALGAIDELLGTNFKGWAEEVSKFMGYLKQQSFEFGKSIADSLNKTENELIALQTQYGENYQKMYAMYSELTQQGIDAQEAMARAYQEYFKSAEAQYVFKERFAGTITGENGIGIEGFTDMTNSQLMDVLSRAVTTTGNTYNFYSPKVIDEKTASEEIKKTNEEIIQGY